MQAKHKAKHKNGYNYVDFRDIVLKFGAVVAERYLQYSASINYVLCKILFKALALFFGAICVCLLAE